MQKCHVQSYTVLSGREREESELRRRVWSSAVVLALFAVLVPGLSAQAAPERRAGPLPLEQFFDAVKSAYQRFTFAMSAV